MRRHRRAGRTLLGASRISARKCSRAWATARMMRRTDADNKIDQALAGGDPARAALMRGITPKSPFQIGAAAAASARGLCARWSGCRHCTKTAFRVWPFEDAAPGYPLLVEMYTRLLTGPVAKSNELARHAYLKTRKTSDAVLYGRLPRAVVGERARKRRWLRRAGVLPGNGALAGGVRRATRDRRTRRCGSKVLPGGRA